MQKWLPDDFASGNTATAAVVHPDGGAFESNSLESDIHQDEKNRLFLSESGFSGPEAIMTHLTREERAQVFELVEQDITKIYEEREVELRLSLEADQNKNRQDFDQAFNTWTENLQLSLASHLKETADASARLAIQLAGKIVRETIKLDDEVLIRAMEATLFKIEGTKTITVSLNPTQAEWLENQAGLKEKLGIGQIVSDRRVEAGGCLISTEKQEWDATIESQLNYLGELVEEMIATAKEPDLSGEDGKDATLGLD